MFFPDVVLLEKYQISYAPLNAQVLRAPCFFHGESGLFEVHVLEFIEHYLYAF